MSSSSSSLKSSEPVAIAAVAVAAGIGCAAADIEIGVRPSPVELSAASDGGIDDGTLVAVTLGGLSKKSVGSTKKLPVGASAVGSSCMLD